MDHNAERRRGIRCRYDYTDEIKDYVESQYPDFDVAPRAIENALRRGQLKFYQVGRKRYTTPELIDEWFESLVTVAGANGSAKVAANQ